MSTENSDNERLMPQRYVIITKEEPFTTNWFDPENHFNPETIEMVIDRATETYTVDGEKWIPITQDHL